MKPKLSLKSLVISVFLIISLIFVGGVSYEHSTVANASQADAYDLSEWQGRINNHQANNLKNEVSFVILRAQYGNRYQDRQAQNSINQMTNHQIPYGVYSYSLYHNNQQARNEADSLYNRAPRANFYVNDIEQNNAGRRINSATVAWAQEMKRLTSRPVVLYSYSNFIQRYLSRAKSHYDAVWLANYSNSRPQPGYKYDLWQYTSNHYSKALKKRIDASVLNGDKPLSFWIGDQGTDVVQRIGAVKHNKKPRAAKARGAKRVKNSLTAKQLRKYHHEMKHVSKTLKRGRRLSKKERKALVIYKIRHGHNFKF